MKAELKVKFLQYLNQKKQGEGFTLIELLTVIIIIGILTAIALPSFLNQATKAKESEAKAYVNALNKGQQAYFLEKNQFAANTAQLGVGIQTQTTSYTYYTFTVTNPVGTTNVYAISYASSPNLKTYGGKVYIESTANPNDMVLYSFLCESQQVGYLNADINSTSCPPNWNQVGN